MTNQNEVIDDKLETLDTNVLGSLFYDEQDQILSIIKMFNDLLIDFIDKLSFYKKQRNIPEINAIAHQVYGASANIGANRIAAICKIIEQSAKDTDYEKIDMLEMLIHKEVALFNAYIENKFGHI